MNWSETRDKEKLSFVIKHLCYKGLDNFSELVGTILMTTLDDKQTSFWEYFFYLWHTFLQL